jgi:hypothetical protein
MSTLPTDVAAPKAQSVSVSEDLLTVELKDGRIISVPIAWYPRLANGTRKERGNSQLLGGGTGIHWPDVDEDISVAGLLPAAIPARRRHPLRTG